MAWQIHTSFHTSGGAVSACNGFSRSLVGRSIIANLISTERVSSVGFQFNLPSFFCRLIFLQLVERCESRRSSAPTNSPHFGANLCKANGSETQGNASKDSSEKLLFLTYSFPNPSPPFIHHCLPSPPTVCQLFILPKNPPIPPLASSMRACLLKLT